MGARRDRDPRPLGELLEALVGRRGWSEKMAVGTLRASWEEVVGPQVAARSAPVSLVSGVLTVRAEGGAWAAELTLLAPTLAAKADAFLGPDVRVESVRVTGGSAGPSGRARMGR